MIQVILKAKEGIGELVEACARGTLAFSGPDSLCSKVSAMGYSINSLYEMVIAVERSIKESQ